ncbi:MAG: MBL fold metallo-hydrolase [Paracoccaceae bacterium]
MRLTFLGTKADLDVTKRGHRRHSAAMIHHGGKRLMIDCGADWRDRLHDLAPDAIVLTHAHPDHAFGLKDGAPCPVHATATTLDLIADFDLEKTHEIAEREPTRIAGVSVEGFGVEHSIRCPAVGLRIGAPGGDVLYVPDLVYIHDREAALRDLALYVGDGATLERSFVRKRDDHLIGHAPVRQQLTWCADAGIRRALFTHCGRDVVAEDGRRAAGRLRRLANERGVEARFARDGMEVDLDGGRAG